MLFSRDGRTTPDPGLSDAGLARANLPDDLATVSGAFGLEFVQGEPSCPLLFLVLSNFGQFCHNPIAIFVNRRVNNLEDRRK